MSLLYESMTRVVWGEWTIRVWRQYDSNGQIKVGSPADIWHELHKLGSNNFPGDILKVLLELDHVNAVEVTDRDGNGTVVYKDWP